MGRKKKGKGKKPNKKSQSVIAQPSSEPHTEPSSEEAHSEPSSKPRTVSCSVSDYEQVKFQLGKVLEKAGPLKFKADPNLDATSLRSCTEEQLEELVNISMETIYNNVVSKLVSMGYEEERAVNAVLQCGHCYGASDVATNVLGNSVAFLNINVKPKESVFTSLKQVQKYTLSSLLCLLEPLRPELTKGDILWCLLMTGFHLEYAITFQVPADTEPSSFIEIGERILRNQAESSSSSAEIDYSLQRELTFPKSYDLPPSWIPILRKNVARFTAGYRAYMEEKRLEHAKAYPELDLETIPDLDPLPDSGTEVPDELFDFYDSQNLSSTEILNFVLSQVCGVDLNEISESELDELKDQAIVSLGRQINDLEGQVQERKAWAHRKAIEAATKLTKELNELKELRTESEVRHIRRRVQGQHELKRITELERSLRTTFYETEQANEAIKRLQMENAEIRAELEAAKLSASESEAAYLEVDKREKKLLKKIQADEKQIGKIQQEISDEKQKILEVQEELAQIKEQKKEAKAKLNEELKAKEDAMALLEEENCAKKAAEANSKRNLEALQKKLDTDVQNHKNELLKLQLELALLKDDTKSDIASTSTSEPKDAEPQMEKIIKILQELDIREGSSEGQVIGHRDCIICLKREVNIVFLPCAHQIMCDSCSEEYMKDGKALCPFCWIAIERSIRVFGASK